MLTILAHVVNIERSNLVQDDYTLLLPCVNNRPSCKDVKSSIQNLATLAGSLEIEDTLLPE
jgi:hypothetical protein